MKLRLRLLQLLFAAVLCTKAPAQDLYTGVWRAGTDGYALYGGLNWTDFVAKWQTLGSQNLRLVDISTYVNGSTRYYNGVWRAGTDGYYLYGGLNWTDFVAKWQTLGSQGQRLIDVETYLSGSTRLYIGVWRAGTDGYALYGGLNWTDFVAKWQTLGSQNLRLIDVASYVQGGVRLYTGVWRAGTDGYALYNGLNWTDFTAKWKELAAQNLRLINISSYLSGSTRLYMGVWRAGTDAYALWNGTDWESLTSQWAEQGSKNLRLVNLETYESSCDDNCLNNVLMDDNTSTAWRDTYDYQITAGKYHCEGSPTSCPLPSPGDYVTYSWPNLKIGSTYWSRNSVLFDADDQIFTLPFSDAASSMGHNGWLYEPGSWHHAIDYYRTDTKTFKIDAAAPGKVISIAWDNWSGNTMVVSHDVGRVKDAYRTIYMHLQNSPLNDCDQAWTKTVPALNSSDATKYKAYLNATGCPLNKASRNPDPKYWGKASQKIDTSLLGKTVTAGQAIAWAGNTGPGGCGCMDGTYSSSNIHLHIFFAHKDPVDKHWYFFDPYGIYSYPSCYPSGVSDPIQTACARYPIAWKGGKPQYGPAALEAAAGSTDVSAATESLAAVPGIISVSPNPSSGNVLVQYSNNIAGKASLAVYDKAGLIVFNKMMEVKAGSNTWPLQLGNLQAGIYYIELKQNGVASRTKLVMNR